MRLNFSKIIIILFFSFIFLIFYKGLNNSNIYKPSNGENKIVPKFSSKLKDISIMNCSSNRNHLDPVNFIERLSKENINNIIDHHFSKTITNK